MLHRKVAIPDLTDPSCIARQSRGPLDDRQPDRQNGSIMKRDRRLTQLLLINPIL